MKIQWVAEYTGPNPYALAPVVVGDVSLAVPLPFDKQTVLERLRSLSPEWFADEAMPALHEHERPEHNLVILARYWALRSLNEVRGFVEAGGESAIDGGMRIWLGYHYPQLSRNAFNLALQIVLAAALQTPFALEQWRAKMIQLGKTCVEAHPDFQARILMNAAQCLDLPVLAFLQEERCWQIGWGKYARVFFETASNADGHLGAIWQKNKHTSKEILQALGMPIARHVLVRDEQELLEGAKRIGFPCVVKPLGSGGGRGVTANLQDTDSLLEAYAFARQYGSGPLMLEAMVQGDDHRLMVIAGKLVMAVRREASSVIGDGTSTITRLIEQLNRTRSRNLVESHYLKPIRVDSVLAEHVQRQGLALTDVPGQGRRISLRSNANRSTGGICKDVTSLIHPEVRAMAEQLAATTGLYAVGIDYLTTDIAQSPASSGGAFIELNTAPGLSACVAAGFDEVELAKLVLGTGLDRIPVDLLVVRDHALATEKAKLQNQDMGDSAGWVCGRSLQVGKARLHCSTSRPWAAVHAALRNQVLQCLQIVCTPDDLVAHGLPVDKLRLARLVDVDMPALWLGVLQNCALQVESLRA